MKKNHEVVGLVIDAIQQNDTLRFLSAITGCTIKDFDKITYNGSRTVGDYLSILPIFQNDVFSMQAMLELAGLETKENYRIEELPNGSDKTPRDTGNHREVIWIFASGKFIPD